MRPGEQDKTRYTKDRPMSLETGPLQWGGHHPWVGGYDRERWKGGMSGTWEGELGGQKQLEKGRAGVATPSMVDMV